MSRIYINSIHVTQVGFRNEAQLAGMAEFVRLGGHFTKDSISEYNTHNPGTQSGWPIKLSRFEDGQLYCADGHHRLAAIVMGGRQYLEESEYEIRDWTYASYLEINLDCMWVTPFDLRTEIRFSDYTDFKKTVANLIRTSPEAAIEYIIANKHLYAVRRDVHSVHDIMARMIACPSSRK